MYSLVNWVNQSLTSRSLIFSVRLFHLYHETDIIIIMTATYYNCMRLSFRYLYNIWYICILYLYVYTIRLQKNFHFAWHVLYSILLFGEVSPHGHFFGSVYHHCLSGRRSKQRKNIFQSNRNNIYILFISYNSF